MLRTSKFISLAVGLLLGILSQLSLANSVRIYVLSADEWSRPRAGVVIPELASVRSAVSYWDNTSDSRIIIRYPGEDSGEIWASELRDWLISLGIPSDYIILVSGSQAADEIKIHVGSRNDLGL
ncbi:MAG: hypothetical protein ACI8XC_002753 [Gammaproteobacteria bacterium]|jgi:hypothetical protein